MSIGKIGCPCLKCENIVFFNVKEVKEYFYGHCFIANYHQWSSHGEPFKSDTSLYEGDDYLGIKDKELYNPYCTMVIEVASPSLNPNFD